jgi:hypothetical protein
MEKYYENLDGKESYYTILHGQTLTPQLEAYIYCCSPKK